MGCTSLEEPSINSWPGGDDSRNIEGRQRCPEPESRSPASRQEDLKFRDPEVRLGGRHIRLAHFSSIMGATTAGTSLAGSASIPLALGIPTWCRPRTRLANKPLPGPQSLKCVRDGRQPTEI